MKSIIRKHQILHWSSISSKSLDRITLTSWFVLAQFDNDNKSLTTVKDVLLELRRFRLGLIQTAPQLYFSYKAIIEGIRHFNDPVNINIRHNNPYLLNFQFV